MAGFLRRHGAVVVLALALVMEPLTPGVAGAELGHHVVGGDRGWDAASNIAEWSAGEVFRVGDSIWFTYSAAEESIAELGSREEFDGCDLSNPIRMYTDGLNEVALEGQGPRYFASGRPESCRAGLKLHVAALPPLERAEGPAAAWLPGGDQVPTAYGPASSGSTPLAVSGLVLWAVVALLCSMGLAVVA
uniref:Early nodulin-like protein 2 n=1 Tax=Anthurium amnicola TaxID=1678845 RepID=A0A1D1XS13_9ARAE